MEEEKKAKTLEDARERDRKRVDAALLDTGAETALETIPGKAPAEAGKRSKTRQSQSVFIRLINIFIRYFNNLDSLKENFKPKGKNDANIMSDIRAYRLLDDKNRVHRAMKAGDLVIAYEDPVGAKGAPEVDAIFKGKPSGNNRQTYIERIFTYIMKIFREKEEGGDAKEREMAINGYIEFPLEDLQRALNYSDIESARIEYKKAARFLRKLRFQVEREYRKGGNYGDVELLTDEYKKLKGEKLITIFPNIAIEGNTCEVSRDPHFLNWRAIERYEMIYPDFVLRIRNENAFMLANELLIAMAAHADTMYDKDGEIKTPGLYVYNMELDTARALLDLPALDSKTVRENPKKTIKDPIKDAVKLINAEALATGGEWKLRIVFGPGCSENSPIYYKAPQQLGFFKKGNHIRNEVTEGGEMLAFYVEKGEGQYLAKKAKRDRKQARIESKQLEIAETSEAENQPLTPPENSEIEQ